MNRLNYLLIVVIALYAGAASAEPMTSTNYGIPWSVNDGGGVAAFSANYTIENTIAQSSAHETSSSSNYALDGGFFAAPDADADSIRDFMDNCTLDQNTSQYDSNGDGYGNLCDPDLDNNGVVNFIDYAMLTGAFLTTPVSENWNPDADLTGDNVVNFFDIALFQFFFLQMPGPSGISP